MSEIKDATAAVFTDVLENMAFLLPEPANPGEEPDCRHGALRAHVSFAGPLNGSLQAAAPEEFCTALATGMLGLDPGDTLPDNAAEDALKELVNVAAGELLEKLAGARPLFNLSVPACDKLTAQNFKTLANRPESVTLIVDDLPFIAMTKISKE